MLKLNLCSVVLHLLALFAVAFSHDMCECRYVLTEQPSNDHLCNPYPTGRFVTRCIVEFTTREGGPLSLEWLSTDTQNNPPQPVVGSSNTISTVSSVGSVLTVPLPSGTPQTHEGFRYFCRVKFSNATILKDSQNFYLFPRDVLNRVLNYPDCNVTDVLSTKFQECIDPGQVPEPTTAAPTTSEPTTSPPTTEPPTLPPTTTEPEVPTTMPTDPPTTTTEAPPTTSSSPPTTMSHPPTTSSKPPPPPPTTPPPTTPPPPTTTTPDVSTPGMVGLGLTFEEQILLFSAIAAVIVLIVVVLLLLLCLCLWNRLCQQSKYCTCCSRY